MVRCQYATVECSYVPTGNEVQMAIPQADPYDAAMASPSGEPDHCRETPQVHTVRLRMTPERRHSLVRGFAVTVLGISCLDLVATFSK